jgi:Anti-sigma factor NepR
MKMNHYFGFKIPPGSGSKKGSTELIVTDQIGRHLRGLYEDDLRRLVPGHFLELLRQLEGASSVLPDHVGSDDREA